MAETDAQVNPGLHTVRELFDHAGFDFESKATVDYGAGPFVDYRLVRVGGLPFDNVDQVIHVPESADSVSIELDGELVKSLRVKPDGEFRHARDLPDNAQLPN